MGTIKVEFCNKCYNIHPESLNITINGEYRIVLNGTDITEHVTAYNLRQTSETQSELDLSLKTGSANTMIEIIESI